MAFNFLKRKQEKTDTKNESKKSVKELAIKKYLENMSNYVAFHEYEYKKLDIAIDEEKRESLLREYGFSVSSIMNYLKEKFPDVMLDGNNFVELDMADMEDSITDKAYQLLCEPQYPSIIDVKRNSYSTHFHVMNGQITQAENIQALPNLNPVLATEKLNNIFKNLTVEELTALLHQMRILPKDNDLERVVENYKGRVRIHTEFLYSIIYALLSTASTLADVRRARLFADSFDISFDFEPYENLINSKQTKLYLTNC